MQRRRGFYAEKLRKNVKFQWIYSRFPFTNFWITFIIKSIKPLFKFDLKYGPKKFRGGVETVCLNASGGWLKHFDFTLLGIAVFGAVLFRAYF